jgi:threonine dehydrogenase-like Zn-dependent dehydrogenase
MSKTYKAAIYRDVGKVEVIEKEYPVCGDNDVIVKNLMATICGADYVAYKSDGEAQQIWKNYEFGHEMVSEVVEKGKNVTGVEIGDWIFPNMGYAYHDRKRMATVGGFSEYLLLPDYKADGNFDIPAAEYQPSAIKLDKSLGLKNLCLLEPFAVGCKAANAVAGNGKKTAVVVGGGIIGLSTAIMLKYYGFEKIMIIDFSEFRLANAREFGMLTCNPKNENLEEVLFENFGKRPAYGGMKCLAECWFDCIGIQPCIDYFFKHAGFGAVLSIVGVHHKPAQIDAVSVCYNNQMIKGCGSSEKPMNYKQAFDDICDCIRKGTDISKTISHEYPLEKIEEALIMHGNFDQSQKIAISYT